MASLTEINERLFAQMDRLSGANLKGDDLLDEVKRADAMVALADQMVDGAKVQLAAAKLFADHGTQVLQMLPQIGLLIPVISVAEALRDEGAKV